MAKVRKVKTESLPRHGHGVPSAIEELVEDMLDTSPVQELPEEEDDGFEIVPPGSPEYAQALKTLPPPVKPAVPKYSSTSTTWATTSTLPGYKMVMEGGRWVVRHA